MEANQEFTATTLERLQPLPGAWYRSTPSPTVRCGRGASRSAVWGAGAMQGRLARGRSDLPADGRLVQRRGHDHRLPGGARDSELASTVGYEHWPGRDRRQLQPVRIRATHIYRREQDEWKLVHRHGDLAPVDASPSIPMPTGGGRGERAGGPRGLRTPRAARGQHPYEVHPDYALEMPQSGERIRGRDNLRGHQHAYPPTHHPAAPGGRCRRRVVVEAHDYGGASSPCHRHRRVPHDGKTWRETRYYAEPFQAPQWRTQWVEPMEQAPTPAGPALLG